MTDKEVLQALLAGRKLEKLLQQGSGRYLVLDGDNLVDNEGNTANIYRLNKADVFVVYEEKENEKEE
jgi:hypothetical protein